jgi:hypothetical protein
MRTTFFAIFSVLKVVVGMLNVIVLSVNGTNLKALRETNTLAYSPGTSMTSKKIFKTLIPGPDIIKHFTAIIYEGSK